MNHLSTKQSKRILTVFCHSPPKHQGSFEPDDTSGRAEVSAQLQNYCAQTQLSNKNQINIWVWQVQVFSLCKKLTWATRALWRQVCESLPVAVSTLSPCIPELDRAGFWNPELGRSSEEGWFRTAATHSSTWKCKKLFQEYFKNRSYANKDGMKA